MQLKSFDNIPGFQAIELEIGGETVPGLFTDYRIDRKTLPQDVYAYDIRSDDELDNQFCTIENHVMVNHTGTVITMQEIPLEAEMAEIDDYNLMDYTTFEEWRQEQ